MFLRIALQRSQKHTAAGYHGLYHQQQQPLLWGSSSYFCRHASLPRLTPGLKSHEKAAAEYIYGASTPTPIKELVHLRDVIYLLNMSNEMAVKKAVLKRFALELREILLLIYNPRVRFNVTSSTLLRYAERRRQEEKDGGGSNSSIVDDLTKREKSGFKYDSLLPLLKDLELNEVTGNAKMDRLSSFLLSIEAHEERVKNKELKQKASLQDIFFRLLDRNLRAGISSNTIQSVFDSDKPESKKLVKIRAHLRKSITHYLEEIQIGAQMDPNIWVAGSGSPAPIRLRRSDSPGVGESLERSRQDEQPSQQQTSEQEPGTLAPESSEDQEERTTRDKVDDRWGVALGKSCTLDELDLLFSKFKAQNREGVNSWYLSRKLDGVRCIMRVNIDVSGSKGMIPYRITNVEALSRAGNQFTSLGVLTRNLASLLSTSTDLDELVREAVSIEQRRLGLEEREEFRPSSLKKFTLYLDGEVCALHPQKEGGDGGYMEDFQGIVGLVRRKDYEIETPAYFPFDMLTQSEFEDWQVGNGDPSLRHAPFHLRKKRLEGFTTHCQEQGSIFVRSLEQTVVKNADQVKEASQEAAQKGWEGLILRRGSQYEGKRTTAIRKLKHWQEDEYMVRGVQKAIMRMPVDQVYEDREGLASVTIRHAGHEVSVGSGFTVEERLRYGQDPESLIGKYITVQYFGESTSVKRVGQASLRFPRVKKVWEDGKRDV